MRVLLAGGAGYIGAHTAVALLEAGHEVVLLDDLSNTSAVAAERVAEITGKDVPLVVGDAADDEVVAAVFDQHGPIDAIVHLAAFKAVGESTQKPLEYYSNNLDTTYALLARGHRARHPLVRVLEHRHRLLRPRRPAVHRGVDDEHRPLERLQQVQAHERGRARRRRARQSRRST